MENTQDPRRQVPCSRKIRPRRVQAKGLDLITHCGICPQSEESKLQSIYINVTPPAMLLKRHVIYYVSNDQF